MADQRPNIIFIITDQQRFDTICAHGYDYVHDDCGLQQERVVHASVPCAVPSFLLLSLFLGLVQVHVRSDSLRVHVIQQLNPCHLSKLVSM